MKLKDKDNSKMVRTTSVTLWEGKNEIRLWNQIDLGYILTLPLTCKVCNNLLKFWALASLALK